MECTADLLLQVAVEIDQNVAAGDEIDAREGRVFEQVVDREQHQVAQFLAHAVVVALAREEAAQTLLADVRLDRGRIASFPRDGERAGVEIGAENLDRGTQLVARGFLQQQHADRIGFLTGRAAGHPDAQGFGRVDIL